MAKIDTYDYITLPKIEPYRKFLRKKHYLSADLNASYRVINHWTELGLINDDREDSDSSKWRRFSIVDIVWAYIIKELRKYGFGLDKILTLKSWMFDYAFDKNNPSFSLEFRIFLTMSRTPVNLHVYENGFGMFTATSEQSSEKSIKSINEQLDRSSFISIDLNRIVSKVMRKESKPVFDNKSFLTDEEFELVNFIRFNKFDEIRVILNDGKLSRFEGKNSEKVESDIIDIIKKDKFQRIEVLVAGNNVVRINRTVQKKL